MVSSQCTALTVQAVEVHNLKLRILGRKEDHDVGRDKACTTSDQDILGLVVLIREC